MNSKWKSRTSRRCRALVLGVVVSLFFAACSGTEPVDPNESAGSPESTEATGSEAAAAQPGDDAEAPIVPQYDSYRLSYSSTCGDGPFFTDGTEIEVFDGDVTVISGEEPLSAGSLAFWNDVAATADADGRLAAVELSPDGPLKFLDVTGRGIDDEFCVTVSAFENLSEP